MKLLKVKKKILFSFIVLMVIQTGFVVINSNYTNSENNSSNNYKTISLQENNTKKDLPVLQELWRKDLAVQPRSLAVADINDDTKLDIILGSQGNDNTGEIGDLMIFDGNGSIFSNWTKSTFGGYHSIAIADIDGDSELEIVTIYNSNTVTIFNSDGNVLSGWPQKINNSYSLALADIDGDSKLEVIITAEEYNSDGPGEGSVYILKNDGSILPGWPKKIGNTCTKIAIADVNNDGETEIIVGYSDGGKGGIMILEANGSVFPGWPQTTIGYVESISLADIDEDGIQEIICSFGWTEYGNGVIIYKIDGSVFPDWPKYFNFNVYSSNIADIDADHKFEIVVAYTSGICVLESDGTFLMESVQLSTNSGFRPYFAIVDVNGDSKLEIIVCSIYNISIFDFEGKVLSSWDLGALAIPSSLAIADVNGDSKLEIIATYENYGNYGGFIVVLQSTFLGYAPYPTDSVNNKRQGAYIDTDHDRLFNHEEIMLKTSISNNDTDLDSISDFDEVVIFRCNPLLVDSDFDGLNDTTEIYFYNSSPNSADSDSDGLNDYEEVFIYKTNITNADTDSDGITDGYEIYSDLNPFSDDSSEDLDSDGLTNFEEFSLGTFANNSDTDGDALTDYEEVKVYLTDPLNNDSDSDGLLDGEEINEYGTDPLNPDTDNDGEKDGEEVLTGFDPLNSKSNLARHKYIQRIIIFSSIVAFFVLLVLGFSIGVYSYKKLKNKQRAEELGFATVKEMLSITKLGFDNKKEYMELTSQGYRTKAEYLQAQKREQDYTTLINLLNSFRPDIPVSLQRIAEISEIPKTTVEQYIKNILQSNPSIGEYFELEQSFIRRKEIEIDTEIDKLLQQYSEWEEVGEGKKKD